MGKDLLAYRGAKACFSWITVLTLIQAGMIVMQAYWLARAIVPLFEQQGVPSALAPAAWFTAALVLRYLLQSWKEALAASYASRLTGEKRDALFQKIGRLGPGNTVRGTGGTVTTFVEGMSQFQRYVELSLVKIPGVLIIPVVTGAVVLSQDIRSGVVLFTAFPILIVFMILLGVAAKAKANKQWHSYQLLSNHFIDSVRGLKTLVYLGKARGHEQNIRKVSEQYRKATMSTLKVAFLSSFALDFFAMLSVAVVAVFLGLNLIEGQGELLPALFVLIMAPEFFMPVRELGSDFHATLDGKEAGAAAEQWLAEKEKNQEPELQHEWTDQSRLMLKNISVTHAGSEANALNEVSAVLGGFEKIMIAGDSGSGKSTLIHLLAGFLPASNGAMVIDGEWRTHLQQEGWRQQIAYIPQHPHIFAGTIEENICMNKPEASKKEVNDAARQAGLSEWIKSLPKKEMTVVGGGGRGISGGQGQRIAIARAFLSGRPILLMDEPTEHLDIETEYDIKQRLKQLFEGKLVIMATHRMHWLNDVDRVIFLKETRVAGDGSPEGLMRSSAAFQEWIRMQRREAE
ncbi:thiol reductant ABC exporter subunit CydD [Marinococcus luteus]|uniref:thiol reductant ABC exporter subunit CydD n=1 Tax=Marinococcus luteus TaxID=1122204 RepID=UPI002ACC8DAB|nr:thiol reductant ABC exporter subunit CydD [Marinococcus luteus]MDZ5784357.1 thiol reductant ABC exporter subunit CydD [Marinococcus luteus]